MDIAENVAIVRSRIAEAALAAGRRPEDIRLVAATKMNDAARVQQAIKAGVEICGENRVQEMLEKNAQAGRRHGRTHRERRQRGADAPDRPLRRLEGDMSGHPA